MDDQTIHAVGTVLRAIQRNSGYHARLEIERLWEKCRADPKRLEPFGFKVYSQNDEDGIIEEIFRRLGIEAGTFCEIGVEKGLQCNTLYLIHKGWRGGWVEGDTRNETVIREKFATVMDKQLRVAFAVITAKNVNQIFDQPGMADLDFLSIDIDGTDIHLFRALQGSPKVICIEYNAKWPPNVRKVPVYDPSRIWTGTDYMGSSVAALNDVAVEKGYRLVGTNLTGSNAFFVRIDLAGSLFTDDASPEYLHNPPRYWLYFDHYGQIGHPADFGPYEDLVG